MKYLFLTILLLSSASQAVTLDLSKFKAKARTSLENLIGKQNLRGNGTVIFRDGASNIELDPSFDHGEFLYVVTPVPGILPNQGLKIAYRLGLNGNEDIVIFQLGNSKNYDLAKLGSGVVTLNPNTSEAEVNQFIHKLSQLSPHGKFRYLSSIGYLTFEAPVFESILIFKEITQSKIATAFQINRENYIIPFQFDQYIVVRDLYKIDADKYRGITNLLKRSGRKFGTETTVPRDLQ